MDNALISLEELVFGHNQTRIAIRRVCGSGSIRVLEKQCHHNKYCHLH